MKIVFCIEVNSENSVIYWLLAHRDFAIHAGSKNKFLLVWNCLRSLQLCLCVYYSFNHVQLLATPWMVAHQAPLSMGFPRQEYWSGLQFPPPEDLCISCIAGRFFII